MQALPSWTAPAEQWLCPLAAKMLGGASRGTGVPFLEIGGRVQALVGFWQYSTTLGHKPKGNSHALPALTFIKSSMGSS